MSGLATTGHVYLVLKFCSGFMLLRMSVQIVVPRRIDLRYDRAVVRFGAYTTCTGGLGAR